MLNKLKEALIEKILKLDQATLKQTAILLSLIDDTFDDLEKERNEHDVLIVDHIEIPSPQVIHLLDKNIKMHSLFFDDPTLDHDINLMRECLERANKFQANPVILKTMHTSTVSFLTSKDKQTYSQKHFKGVIANLRNFNTRNKQIARLNKKRYS